MKLFSVGFLEFIFLEKQENAATPRNKQSGAEGGACCHLQLV
jgi:hypothetical protein